MREGRPARAVDLPLPLAPVTDASPFFSEAIRSIVATGRRSPSNVGIRYGMGLNAPATDSRWMKRLTRNRQSPGARWAKSSSRSCSKRIFWLWVRSP